MVLVASVALWCRLLEVVVGGDGSYCPCGSLPVLLFDPVEIYSHSFVLYANPFDLQ
jgi:hypothetical protein